MLRKLKLRQKNIFLMKRIPEKTSLEKSPFMESYWVLVLRLYQKKALCYWDFFWRFCEIFQNSSCDTAANSSEHFIAKSLPIWHLLIQSQRWKCQNNMWNMFLLLLLITLDRLLHYSGVTVVGFEPVNVHWLHVKTSDWKTYV